MFGQTSGQTQGTGFGGPLFGQNTGTSNNNSLFSAKDTNGGTNTANTSVFGAKPAGASSGGLFGSSGATNTVTAPGALFGPSTPAPAPAQGSSTPAATGLFGSQPAASTTPAFGQQQQQQPATGGLFGSSTPAPATGSATGGLFGSSTPAATGATSGLFGSKPAATSTGSAGGLFGQSTTAQPAASGSLFGSNTAQTQPQTTSLFGQPAASTAPAGSLFGQSAAPAANSGSLFGAQQPANALGTAAGTTAPGAAAPLYATIDAPAFDFLDSVPAPKLYTSLSKRHAQPKLKSKEVVVAAQPEEPEPVQTAPKRKFMNDYKEFLEVRPTNLQIKRQRVVVGKPKSRLSLPSAGAVAALAGAPGTKGADSSSAPGLPAPAVHIFGGDLTTVTVNKRALEQGYYMRPSLDELIGYSKTQLKSVPNFIVGRSGYGQVEYPEPVDLSQLSNLGDIMGTLVVFSLGAVSVYPDETKKAPQGTQLNKPAVVTIEQIHPRDAAGELLAPSDPRVGKFVEALKRKCTSRGAEFLTFTQGVWVFKVPHFSTWGLDPDEMIVEDFEEVEIHKQSPPKALSAALEAPILPAALSSTPGSILSDLEPEEFASAVEPVIANQMLFLEAKTAPVSPKQTPMSWVDLLGRDGVLRANRAMVEADTSNVRMALFDGATVHSTGPVPALQAPPEPAPTPLALSALQAKTSTKSRTQTAPQGDLPPLLTTHITFSDLEACHAGDAWGIAAMLFDGGDVKSSLSAWLARSIGPMPDNLQGLDAIWWLVTAHRLEEAAQLAAAEDDLSLVTTIAGLSQGDEDDETDETAGDLLQQLLQTQTLSPPARKIYEVAANNFDFPGLYDGLDWKQCVGLRLWYGCDPVSELLNGVEAPSNTELAMLKLVGAQKGAADSLKALLALVDEGVGFLMLQALQQSSAALVEPQVADELYESYAAHLLRGNQVDWAVFVALHIADSAAAVRVVEQILKDHPTLESAYLPRSLVAASLAAYARREGRFNDEVKLLLECDKQRAEQVFLAEVAPRAVLAGDLEVLELFDGVYNDYRRFVAQPSGVLAVSISARVGNLSGESLVVRAAAAQISRAVADSPALTSTQALEMPLHEGLTGVVCKRAFADLVQ